MNGPAHYREAERLIGELSARAKDESFTHEDVAMIQRTAQVHATLALAAATAMSAPVGAQTNADRRTWLDAASAHVRPGGTA